MDWDWKAVAVIIAALLAIAFNAYVQWKQLRREKMIALRKALYSLIEIWYMLTSVKATRNNHGGDDEHYALSIAMHLKPMLGEISKQKDRHVQAIELLSKEYPLLAIKMRFYANCLSEIEELVEIVLKQDNTHIIMNNNEISLNEFLSIIYTSIDQSVVQVGRDALVLAQKCGKRTYAETLELLVEESIILKNDRNREK